jgi:hypothetical protein
LAQLPETSDRDDDMADTLNEPTRIAAAASTRWNWQDALAYFLLFCFAVVIYDQWIGFRAMVPSYVDWLYSGDFRQSFAAQNLFRQSAWHFPLGHVANGDFPVGTNIVFMDGNLLLAIVAKLLMPLTGSHSQLYGAWIFVCVLLQFWSIYWSLRQLDVSAGFGFFGAVLIGLLPTFFFRIGHLNLLAHFLIVFGWGTLLSKYMNGERKLATFLLLIVASTWIHPYFTPPLVVMAMLAQWNERGELAPEKRIPC